jgi:hypothetical protein
MLTYAARMQVLPPDRIVRKGTFAIVNYLRVLADAGGAPAEVVERGAYADVS